ncbi:MAG: polyphenol oxidase family protein [Deltaproteobacteria bacterium]|nr:polyphenol oxidase family protein [Deltaproteobacteria bacterium]
MDENFSQGLSLKHFCKNAQMGFSMPLEIVDSSFVRLKQVHGSHGHCLSSSLSVPENLEGDWFWTGEENMKLGISVADCTAILISGKNSIGNFVAAIHAGWRGTADKIIEKALDELKPEGEFFAWLSPSICQEHFEVGAEVIGALGDEAWPFTKISEKSTPAAEKFYLALKGFQKFKLNKYSGIRISESSLCTYCQPEFYSYRRDKDLRRKLRHLAWIQRA